MGRRELLQRGTLYDLYLERSALPRYYRFLATIGTWMILAGYVVLAAAANPNRMNLITSKTSLVAAGIVLLVLGHILAISTYLFAASLTFRFDVVLVPAFVSCSIGFLAVLLNQRIHFQGSFDRPLVYLPILFSLLGVLTSIALALWIQYRIHKVKELDIRRRKRPEQHRDSATWRPSSIDNSAAKLLPDLPDDELQRQQLERLLFKNTNNRAPSPDAQTNTYRIDIPSPYSPNHGRHLSVPENNYGRVRSYSAGNNNERSGWQLQNLRNLLHSRRQQADSWKDPRERRREEIERAGYDARTAMLRMPANAHDGGYIGSPLISPPAQSPAYRYA